jgi:hypothetical protein
MCDQRLFENEQLAISNWQLAKANPAKFATFCRLGLGLGLGLGHPWVTQAWPKGHPSVTQGRPKGRFRKVLLFATKVEKGGGGRKSPEPRVIAEIARDRKSKTAEALSSPLTRRLQQSTKKARPPGLFSLMILRVGLLAEARRRDVTAVSTDDSAGYGIIVTSSGIE